MKLYLNLDLEIKKLTKIIEEFSKISVLDSDYLKYGTLNRQETIKTFVEELAESEIVYAYDYSSFGLKLTEFKQIFDALEEKNITIIFLKEDEFFTEFLKGIIENERTVTSKIGINKIRNSRKVNVEKKVLGRPKINYESRKKINYLYQCQKMSMRQIADACEVSLGTVHKYVTQTKNNAY